MEMKDGEAASNETAEMIWNRIQSTRMMGNIIITPLLF